MSDAPTATRKRAPRKTQFDLADRERIRAALRNYMQQNRIGAPALQFRIAEATDRPPDLLPLKTLQRFLADCGRTNDAFLQPCFQFVQTLPSAGKTEDFVRDLAGFFGLEAAVRSAGEDGAAKSAPVRLEGQYRVYANGQEKKFVVLEKDDDNFTLAYSICAVTGNEGSRYTFREDVFNPALVTPVPEGSARHILEGALLFFDPLIFIVAKNLLTRLPRVYWLRDFGDGLLMGVTREAAFLHDKNVARPYKGGEFAFRRTRENAEP